MNPRSIIFLQCQRRNKLKKKPPKNHQNETYPQYSQNPLTSHHCGAPGSLSITYFPLATFMIGTPGTLRSRRCRSLSSVPTM